MSKRGRTQPARRPAPRLRRSRPRSVRRRDAAAGREFQALVDIMARLRGPRGCPWDREQTIESLRGFVLEEAYEVLDAIDRRDHAALRGEIGDLLFEGVFLAQIEADAGRFNVADSLRAICQKLIRRHPHIFAAAASDVRTPGQVVEQWEQIKAREQKDAGERRSLLRGVPKSLPSLLRAHEIGTRVAAVGFDWVTTADVVDKIEEEVAELRRAVEGEGRDRAQEEMGDLLFSIANLARKLRIEPESALRMANEKFTSRFEQLEHAFDARGQSVHGASLEEMEREWAVVKSAEVDGPTAHTKKGGLTAGANKRGPTAHAKKGGPTAGAKIRRSEEAKAVTRAGRPPAGGRRWR